MKDLIENQKKFFRSGETLSLDFRLNQLKALKKTLLKYDEELVEVLKEDLNKSAFESVMTEIALVHEELNLHIKNLKKWNKPQKVKVPLTLFPGKSMLHREPYGVSLIISPWNYPILLTLQPLIASIASGNCTVLKLSEFSENTSLLLRKMILETFPQEYVLVILGDAVVGARLLMEKFDNIFFTGNANVGKIVMKAASANLTPVTLELGGKSPCIVHEDADIKDAAKKIIWGKSLNAGQTCVAPDYIIAHSSIKNDLIEEMIKYSTEKFGEHSAINEDFPKIISKKHYERILRISDGQKIVFGGRFNERALKIDMTIMDKVSWNDKIMQEEIFAPILPVITYNKIEDVIENIKDDEKPLALYLFTKDKNIEKEVIEKVSFGGGCINDVIMQLSNKFAPFGGVGFSGLGSYHGKYSLDAFSRLKHVYKKFSFFDNGLRYNPKKSTLKLIRKWFY